MDIGRKLKDFIIPDDEDEQSELTEEEKERLSSYEQPKVEGATKVASNTNIMLFEPRQFAESKQIADHLKANRACAINLHRMQADYRQRVVDFLYGVIYALDGSLNQVGEDVYLCSPKTMPVGGQIKFDDNER